MRAAAQGNMRNIREIFYFFYKKVVKITNLKSTFIFLSVVSLSGWKIFPLTSLF